MEHEPLQPTAGQSVTITAHIDDVESEVADVSLLVQVVEPGQYIKKSDAAYEDASRWTTAAMTDEGDGVFTATLAPGMHRGLVRYRIRAEDSEGQSVRVPYPDDEGGNFAYFIYDGVPDWSGDGQTYDAQMLSALPVYHLLTTEAEIIETQWSGDTTKEFLGEGTMVYDGVVYDHVLFRSRGGNFRYDRGKNQWKIKFRRGHEFVARDNWGRPYETPWRVVNFGRSMHGRGGLSRRGEDGIYEAASYAMNRLAGMPSCVTTGYTFESSTTPPRLAPISIVVTFGAPRSWSKTSGGAT